MAQTNDSICSLFRCAKLPFFSFTPMMNYIIFRVCVCAHTAKRKGEELSRLVVVVVDRGFFFTLTRYHRWIYFYIPKHASESVRSIQRILTAEEREKGRLINNFIHILFIRNLISPRNHPKIFPFCTTVSVLHSIPTDSKLRKLSSLRPFCSSLSQNG